MERKSRDELKIKANLLPLTPGVYIMRSSGGRIVYIGKSKCLKNRVSQYFSDSAKNVKTEAMVSNVWDFDYMLTETETEALALENKLIKLHMPKYNILLKDGKNYPYIKVTMNEEYPRVTMVRKRVADKGRYFGPYSSSHMASSVIKTVNRVFGIPVCSRRFPRDIGKERPCIYSQIGQCCAVCSGNMTAEDYRERFDDVMSFLRGNYGEVRESLTRKMKYASENMLYETAALYRDRIASLSVLWDKQKVIGAPDDEFDIISMYADEMSTCIAVYYVRNGAVIDSDNFIFSAERVIDDDGLASFICEMYTRREYVPGTVMLGFGLPDDQLSVMSEYLRSVSGKKVNVRIPAKGSYKKLCDMVADNARLHALQYNAEAERDNGILVRLASMLCLEVVPESIEAIDISNYGSDNITAGIIALTDGKPDKKKYRLYKIHYTDGQDDYASMREALERRISHAAEQPLPDLYLLDGGKGHVSTVKRLFEEKNINIPVFGMVKDEYHKTRALTDGENEISIAREQSVFVFIYKIQEEVHRFTINAMKKAKSKTLVHSSLEKIDGIGRKKAVLLLAAFGSVTALKQADEKAIADVKGISASDAKRIREYFDKT